MEEVQSKFLTQKESHLFSLIVTSVSHFQTRPSQALDPPMRTRGYRLSGGASVKTIQEQRLKPSSCFPRKHMEEIPPVTLGRMLASTNPDPRDAGQGMSPTGHSSAVTDVPSQEVKRDHPRRVLCTVPGTELTLWRMLLLASVAAFLTLSMWVINQGH